MHSPPPFPKLKGSIRIWRYLENERNYPGWHLTGDECGCTSFIDLLHALSFGDPPSRRIITLRAPTSAELAVPNNRGGTARHTFAQQLRLATSADPTTWQLTPSLDHDQTSAALSLTIGSQWLAPLCKGLSDITRGEGDYSIGNADGLSSSLWFWWQPRPASR